MPLILASASPRRAELLRAAGLRFEVVPADVDETVRSGEAAERYVSRLAVAKAVAVAARYPGRAVLSADTVVAVGEDLLGKPRDASDATRMLGMLAGRGHEVLTGVCLLPPADPAGHWNPRSEVDVTTVWFAPMSKAEIAWYVATGEPMDKAGAYAIQGLASRFVTRIEGSYSNVVGLPVARVYQLCTEAGMLVS